MLVSKLSRWDVKNAAELCYRALYRMTDADGKRLAPQLQALGGRYLFDRYRARAE